MLINPADNRMRITAFDSACLRHIHELTHAFWRLIWLFLLCRLTPWPLTPSDRGGVGLLSWCPEVGDVSFQVPERSVRPSDEGRGYHG